MMHTRVLQLVEILSSLYYEPLITWCKKYIIGLLFQENIHESEIISIE